MTLDESLQYIKAFIYGPPKVGKTVLSGTASVYAPSAPVLFCDIEGGRASLRDAPKTLINKSKIRIVEITSFEQLNDVYELVSDNPGAVKTVVIDSITELHTMSMEEQMRLVVARDPTREEFVPAPREWGIARAQIRKIIRQFRALPCHLIITAMLRYDEDPVSGIVHKNPQLAGQLQTEIPGYCDIVGLMEIVQARKKPNQPREEAKRILYLKEVSRAMVGTRAWNIPSEIENPTFEQLCKIILGG